LSVKYFDAWKDALASNRVKNCSGLVEEMRMHKSKEEIEYLRKGSRITDQVLEDVTTNDIAPGKTEMDIVRAIKSSAVRHGADDTSFHPQIPSGVRTHLFNITSTDKKLKKGEIVLLDYGIAYNGYCTDITRVVSVGQPTSEQRKVFEATKQIVDESIDSVKRGNTAEQVHDTALKWFIKTGYDGHVAHSTGHAMGLAVWERPFLREGDKTELKDGMVLAVEQGIYFTKFGMRLEQNLVVHGKKAEVFNKELEFIIV
jgi:Xaa-Pro dipeptidase